jgi:hypothetical protein
MIVGVEVFSTVDAPLELQFPSTRCQFRVVGRMETPVAS